QLDQQLKKEEEPRRLLERARLRLDRGEVSLAVADLRRARDRLGSDSTAERTALAAQGRQQLHEAFAELFRRDFPAGEPYLNEYRDLCRVAIPDQASDTERAALQREQRQRQIRLLALLARGREKQGRWLEALAHYRELHDQRHLEELLAGPEEASLSIRSDLW